MTDREAKNQRMYSRATEIMEGRANGHALPILRALAVRGHQPAQMYLSHLLLDGIEGRRGFGRGMAWLRQAARAEPAALYNLAVEWRNRGCMAGYRHWLSRAAAAGDEDARAEFKRFETRFPYGVMRKWRRLKPDRRN